jgi:hypothetical protein
VLGSQTFIDRDIAGFILIWLFEQKIMIVFGRGSGQIDVGSSISGDFSPENGMEVKSIYYVSVSQVELCDRYLIMWLVGISPSDPILFLKKAS